VIRKPEITKKTRTPSSPSARIVHDPCVCRKPTSAREWLSTTIQWKPLSNPSSDGILCRSTPEAGLSALTSAGVTRRSASAPELLEVCLSHGRRQSKTSAEGRKNLQLPGRQKWKDRSR